jgi:hypothetical protein
LVGSAVRFQIHSRCIVAWFPQVDDVGQLNEDFCAIDPCLHQLRQTREFLIVKTPRRHEDVAMRMELRPRSNETGAVRDMEWREVVFSPEQAQRALPYISRVVRDAAAAYATVLDCRFALQNDDGAPDSKTHRELCRERDAALAQLNAAIDECNALGADLLDISTGLVRFAGEVDGRSINLLWRLGDSLTDAWPGFIDPDARESLSYAATR